MNPDIVQDPPSSDCLKMWEEELKIVVNQLKNAEADNAKAELTLKNASEWEAKLRALYDSLLQTLATSTDATSELKVFQTQVGLVGQNTTSFREAVEVLYCETRQTYELVETLTSTVQGLLEAVRCIGDSSLNFNDGFLKSLVEFDAKLRAVGNTRTDTLNKVIAALESAYAVEYMICNDDGLSGILEDLYQEFSGERPSETDAAGGYRTGCGCHHEDHS